MGAIVFGNLVLDSWLTKKADEVLSKVDREKISTEEILILILKAQSNHLHNMNELRGELGKIRLEFREVDMRFEQVDTKFDLVDQRFDRLTKVLVLMGAVMVSLFSGLYLKLVF